MGLFTELNDDTSWDWQQVILAAAIVKQRRMLDADDYDYISDLTTDPYITDTRKVPGYATKAFTAAVKYLAKRLEKYRDVSRADSSVYVEPTVENARELAEMISAVGWKTEHTSGILQSLTGLRTVPMDLPCPRCGHVKGFAKSQMIFGGPYSGSVSCECGYRNSVMGFLGHSMFSVEPLPEGDVPIYLREPESENGE